METIKNVDQFQVHLSKLLGQGSFAKVYKAYDCRDTSIEAAVKMVPLAKIHSNKDYFEIFSREIEILQKIKGKHISQLLDVKTTTNNLYIFIEYCDGGSLASQLGAGKVYTEEEACLIVKQIASAFVDLEKLSLTNRFGDKVTVMHRDIKPDNILFHKGQVKVADFGFAKLVSEMGGNLKRAHSICGTPSYEAPQILGGQPYSAKCDIWSAGVLLYEILFGTLPWANTPISRLENTIRSKPLHFPKPVSPQTRDLLQRMLAVREEDRVSWKEILRHPALRTKREINQRAFNQMPQPVREDIKVQREIKLVAEKVHIPNKQEYGPWTALDIAPKKLSYFIKQETGVWPKLEICPKNEVVPIRKPTAKELVENWRAHTFNLKTELQITPKLPEHTDRKNFCPSQEAVNFEMRCSRTGGFTN